KHLCPYKHIDLSQFKGRNNFFIPLLSPGSIKVHPADLMTWKNSLQLCLHLFSAQTFCVKLRTSTSHTFLLHGHMISAVMATQLVFVIVEGQTHITVCTLR